MRNLNNIKDKLKTLILFAWIALSATYCMAQGNMNRYGVYTGLMQYKIQAYSIGSQLNNPKDILKEWTLFYFFTKYGDSALYLTKANDSFTISKQLQLDSCTLHLDSLFEMLILNREHPKYKGLKAWRFYISKYKYYYNKECLKVYRTNMNDKLFGIGVVFYYENIPITATVYRCNQFIFKMDFVNQY